MSNVRVTEGDKALTVSVNSYLKRRDKLTKSEWHDVRLLMRDAENNINQKLRATNLTEWNMVNLNNILENIKVTIDRFDTQFKYQQDISSGNVSDQAIDYVNKNMKAIKIDTSMGTGTITDEVIRTMKPLSDMSISNFTDDMFKIVRSEISIGIFNNSSIAEVAKSLQDKFESSNMSYARAERIATTEMLTSSSLAQDLRAREIAVDNPEVRKWWLSSHKPDLRENHLAIENRTKDNPIPIDQPFNVSGHEAMFPRDPSLPAKERVYCGCTQVIVNPAIVDDTEMVIKKVEQEKK